MKKFYAILIIFLLNFTDTKSNEPFVVLEYKGNFFDQSDSKKLIKIINLLKTKTTQPLIQSKMVNHLVKLLINFMVILD